VSEPRPGTISAAPPEIAFADVVKMIETARQHAYQAVNTTLIELYWQVGAYLSAKLAVAEWGDGVVDQLARYLALTQPGLRGFTRRNLFRMRQFYDTYRDDAKVSALLTQLPWTHNLIILGQSKRPEEREFYLRTAVRERWSSWELERRFRLALFERTMLEPAKVSAALRQSHPDAPEVVKERSYSTTPICAVTIMGSAGAAPRPSPRVGPSTVELQRRQRTALFFDPTRSRLDFLDRPTSHLAAARRLEKKAPGGDHQVIFADR
jgi:predicted nuclease of restriction endonuclease-like (RecB) superfamily